MSKIGLSVTAISTNDKFNVDTTLLLDYMYTNSISQHARILVYMYVVCSARLVVNLILTRTCGRGPQGPRATPVSPQLLLRETAQAEYSGIKWTLVVPSRWEFALLAQLVAVRLIELHIAQVGCVQENGQAQPIGFSVQIRQDSRTDASGRTHTNHRIDHQLYDST